MPVTAWPPAATAASSARPKAARPTMTTGRRRDRRTPAARAARRRAGAAGSATIARVATRRRSTTAGPAPHRPRPPIDGDHDHRADHPDGSGDRQQAPGAPVAEPGRGTPGRHGDPADQHAHAAVALHRPTPRAALDPPDGPCRPDVSISPGSVVVGAPTENVKAPSMACESAEPPPTPRRTSRRGRTSRRPRPCRHPRHSGPADLDRSTGGVEERIESSTRSTGR